MRTFFFDRRETLFLLLVTILGFGVGTWHIVANGVGHFYQVQYAPAVMIACGHDFVVPVFAETPEGASAAARIDAFLKSEVARFECSDVAGGVAEPSGTIDVFQGASRYLMYAAGISWNWFGNSWQGLAPLFGLLCAGFSLGAYGTMRAVSGPAVSMVATAYLVLSPLNLRFLPELRDYAKAPFLLVGIALLAQIVVGRRGERLQLALAVAAGATAGIGLGVRADVLLLVPLFLVSILSVDPKCGWRGRLRMLVGGSAGFLVAALPLVFFFAESGSNSSHWVLLGLGDPFSRALDLDSNAYSVVQEYNDDHVERLVNYFAAPSSGDSVHIGSQKYDYYGVQLYFALAKLFPADFLIRAYASTAKILWLSPWLQPLSATVIAVGAVSVIAARSLRLAAFAAFVIVYLGGTASLQFDPRHHHHLEVISVALTAVLFAGAVRLVRSARERRYTRSVAICRKTHSRRSLGSVLAGHRAALARVGACWCVVLGLGLGVLLVAREYQSERVARLLEEMERSNGERLDWELARDDGEGVLVVPHGEVTDASGRKIELPRRRGDQTAYLYLGVQVSGDRCGGGRLQVEYEGGEPFYTPSITVSINTWGQARTRAFVPIVDRGGPKYGSFRGVRLIGIDPRCLEALFSVSSDQGFRIPLRVVLEPGWRTLPLYQRFSWEDDILAPAPQTEVAYASPLVTGTTAPVPVRVAMNGSRVIALVVDDGGDGNSSDHANWIHPIIVTEEDTLSLSGLSPFSNQQTWGQLGIDRSVTGQTLRIGPRTFESGLGTHAESRIVYRIPAFVDTREATFRALVGVDGATESAGTVRFFVEVDSGSIPTTREPDR